MQRLFRYEPVATPQSRTEITYKTFVGRITADLREEISSLRIRCFRDYPHLYDGDRDNDYEKQCAEELTRSPRTMLITAYCDNALVGFTAAFPLETASEILEGDNPMFLRSGFDPAQFYYWSEAAIAPEFRGFTILRRFYERLEFQVTRWGYRHTCLATIVRETDDPRKPHDYRKPDPLWRRLGYHRTNIEFSYRWPTIMPDGSSRFEPNRMSLWIKNGFQTRTSP